MKKILFALAVCALLTSVFAGPFGLDMGRSIESFESNLKATDEPSAFDLASPPTPHRLFDSYRLWFAKKSGLAGVLALTSPIQTNSFGNQLQSRFDELAKALTAKYGEPKRYDFLQHGSIWNEPEDWMMSLVKKERHLTCAWEGSESKPLPDNLHTIELTAIALDRDAGVVRLIYRFSNFDELMKDDEARDQSAL